MLMEVLRWQDVNRQSYSQANRTFFRFVYNTFSHRVFHGSRRRFSGSHWPSSYSRFILEVRVKCALLYPQGTSGILLETRRRVT